MYKGLYTALVTPFTEDYKIDFSLLEIILEEQIIANVSGIVIAGSTGESATLSIKEHQELLLFVSKFVNGKVQVIAGTGANNTDEAIELTKSVNGLPIDGLLQVCPYYNKPTQNGLYKHFEKIAHSTEYPIILYNIPSRSVINIELQTIEKLLKISNIAAIKESSSDISRISKLCNLSDDFTVLSGDDIMALPIITLGGKGLVSVSSNIIPKRMKQFIDECLESKEKARITMKELIKVFELTTIEQNPLPIKTAVCEKLSKTAYFRLPLTEMSESKKQILLNNINYFQD